MASPSRKRDGISPIRNLEQKSPYKSRKLHPILEEDLYHIRERPSLRAGLNSYSYENQILQEKVKNYADENYRSNLENSQLRRQNILLKDAYTPSTYLYDIDRLTRQNTLINGEKQKLVNDMEMLKGYYEKDIEKLRIQNQSLKKQVLTLEQRMFTEANQIRDKYNKLAMEDASHAKKTYMQDLQKVLASLESTKALLIQKQCQVQSLTTISQQISAEHNAHLEYLISENNILRGKVNQTQLKMMNEVKQAETHKQLQKSRTHGIISYCKETNAFMQKQIRNLAESLLEKTISIDTFAKDVLKLQKNLQITEKKYEEKLFRLDQQRIQQIRELEASIHRLEKFYKEQIAEMSKKEMDLLQKIASRQNQLENMIRAMEHEKQASAERRQQIEELKANISRLHEQHSQQISKVMSESRVKRKSMKNLSEISSLRDLSADGGSQLKKSFMRRNSLTDNQNESSGQLYTVHEQIATSQVVPGGSDDDQLDMKELIIHYESIIQELKNNKTLELKLANDRIQKMNQGLRQKQQQVLQILQRFSPLMQYKLNSQSLEQQRRDKIEKHLKADIDLLGVILDKYKIAGLKKKE